MDSSGEDYSTRRGGGAKKASRRNPKDNRRTKSMANRDDDFDDEGVEAEEDDGEETHGSEELDRFEGYSPDFLRDTLHHGLDSVPRPQPTRPMSQPGQRPQQLPQNYYAQQAPPYYQQQAHNRVSPQGSQELQNEALLRSYSEQPPVSNPRLSQTSLEMYAEPVPAEVLDEADVGARLPRAYCSPMQQRRAASTAQLAFAADDTSRGPRQRFSYPDFPSDFESLVGSGSRPVVAVAGGSATLPRRELPQPPSFLPPMAPLAHAPIISPNNPGHSVVHFESPVESRHSRLRQRHPAEDQTDPNWRFVAPRDQEVFLDEPRFYPRRQQQLPQAGGDVQTSRQRQWHAAGGRDSLSFEMDADEAAEFDSGYRTEDTRQQQHLLQQRRVRHRESEAEVRAPRRSDKDEQELRYVVSEQEYLRSTRHAREAHAEGAPLPPSTAQAAGRPHQRQSIRRQAKVSAPAQMKHEMQQASDISDAFDDDGLFHFEEKEKKFVQGDGAAEHSSRRK